MAMLRELLRRVAAEPSVSTVRAAISPGNVASLATISGFGFAEVGEQWDEEDGRGGRVPAELWARIIQRLLALNAAIWHNWHNWLISASVKRSLIAHDHGRAAHISRSTP